MKKIFRTVLVIGVLGLIAYFAFIYYATFSEGFRAGDLVKISKKGLFFKTWEGTLSQGVSDEQQFHFSVQNNDQEVIDQLKNLQGKRVRLNYIQRYGTFMWLGDTKHFVKSVEEVKVKDSEILNNASFE